MQYFETILLYFSRFSKTTINVMPLKHDTLHQHSAGANNIHLPIQSTNNNLVYLFMYLKDNLLRRKLPNFLTFLRKFLQFFEFLSQ